MEEKSLVIKEILYLTRDVFGDVFPDLDSRLDRSIREQLVWVRNMLKNDEDGFYYFLIFLALLDSREAGSYFLPTITRLRTFISKLNDIKSFSIQNFDPEDALFAYSLDDLHVASYTIKAYFETQSTVQRFLLKQLPKQRAILSQYVLPELIMSPRLNKIIFTQRHGTKRKRKENSSGIVKHLRDIMIFAKKRYLWFKALMDRYYDCIDQVEAGLAEFPVDLKIMDRDGLEELTFRVWNYTAWVEHHKDRYAKNTYNLAKKKERYLTSYFLQFVGDREHDDWFFEAVEAGAFKEGYSERLEKYAQKNSLKTDCFSVRGASGIIKSGHQKAGILRHASIRADDTADDSKIVFDPETFAPAVMIGYLLLSTVVLTGMRMSSFQGITLDRDCYITESYHKHGESKIRRFFNVHMKGASERQPFLIQDELFGVIDDFIALYEKINFMELKKISANSNGSFRTSRYFLGEERKFLVQWNGRHLDSQAINRCLRFLMLGHTFPDANGQPMAPPH